MKKINFLFLSVAFLGGVLIFSAVTTRAAETDTVTAVTTSFNSETLEKILSPDQIKYFRVMKNENGTLYGIRIQNTNQTQTANKKGNANANNKVEGNANASSTLSVDSETLEKISSPDEIKYFRVMKNENGTLYGIRIQNQEQNQEQTQTKTQNRLVGSDIKDCVSAAINVKDEALKTRLANVNEDVAALIDTRNSCQNTALESETDQAENLKACASEFQLKYKELNSATIENHKSIWTNYQTKMKACLPAAEVDEGATLLIEDGGSDTLETAISL